MPWISIPQFAALKGVTKQYIYDLLDRGQIPQNVVRFKKPGGKQIIIHKIKAAEAMGDNVRARPSTKSKQKAKGKKSIKPGKSQRVKPDLIKAEQDKIIQKAGLKIFDSLTEAQKHKETYLAALKKLEYEQKCGELIPAEQVKRDAERAARIVKEKVTSWPGRVAALVAVEPDPFKCDQILRQECNQLLDEIAKEILR